MSPLSPVADVRRATRAGEESILGGVAAGLGHHLGLPTLWVRVAFVVLSALGGLGVMLYAALWLVLPSDERFRAEAPGLEAATRDGRRRGGRLRRLGDAGPAIALGTLGLGVVLAIQTVLGPGALFGPAVVGAAGIALLWRQADEAQRERWRDGSARVDPFRFVLGRGGWASWSRLLAGAFLVVSAIAIFALQTGGSLPVMRNALVAALLGVLGLAIVVGPWLYRLASDLGDERAERVRTQERADLAAHLHDSVLQTLALIQKNADQPATVARLARSQERDLRSWLYDEAPAAETSLAGALRAVAASVEDDHGVNVDVVTVGDVPASDRVRPVVEATREAIVNAAKHAGVARVDVYAEATPRLVEVFVRDRGRGFDPASVAEDRQGVRGSIVDRMDRHGGSAQVRSTPGEGTEVRVSLPLEEE
ncbi:ATP-binding protein [Nocardioides rotundus]|uniref:ATP-binding protein n=1 Tax=Nocardioides rotundus TaxID=1774216 RepID=UPI001CC04187|nr:ATP-binding protein [Nocardioides rotundus]